MDRPFRSGSGSCQTAAVTGFLGGSGPRAFAHRGWHIGALAGLENTIASFRRAYDEGYRYLETDVRATADGQLVVFHDSRLDRVTDRQGAIAELPWSVVRQARVGGTEPIPLLADVFDELPDAMFNIDAKAPGMTSARRLRCTIASETAKRNDATKSRSDEASMLLSTTREKPSRRASRAVSTG